MTSSPQSLIIAGGGLSGCLAALALAKLQPDVSVLLVESGPSFGGEHTWSFFDSDVSDDARWLIDPLVTARWDSYDVVFPKRRRTLRTAYNSVTSDRLDRLVRERLRPEQYRLSSPIEAVAPDHVRLASGERIEAAGVIDARGPANFSAMDLGWQKFVGCEYRFKEPHGLTRPIVMDATVDQTEGFRFVYCLPFDETHLLVEDTYYSLSPALDRQAILQRIEAYVETRGWKTVAVEREETGVLPVAMGGSIEALWAEGPGVAKLGLRGGFFHPTTGYSLPDAVRMALLVARQRDLGSAALDAVVRGEAMRLWKERGFYRILNRMLFDAADPPERYKVLQHFYRIDADAVARFYAGRSGLLDKARILSGKPPVPVGRALAALRRRRSRQG